ncbi:MTH938/NDUFAF3 family protein [Cupriavidus lacunae]|nr:MTH938/NDUFAF3 family protein [Cupriavidus lacunae]
MPGANQACGIWQSGGIRWVLANYNDRAGSSHGMATVEVRMRFEAFSFGSICIDGVTYEHDVVIDQGKVRKRRKGPSKPFREAFGHTPLSVREDIPWNCSRLVIGTGSGALPVMDEVKQEAKDRHVKLVIAPTAKAIATLEKHPGGTNAVLHLTC